MRLGATAYRNARDLCLAEPAERLLPLAEGEPAGRLAEAASAELDLLELKGGCREAEGKQTHHGHRLAAGPQALAQAAQSLEEAVRLPPSGPGQ